MQKNQDYLNRALRQYKGSIALYMPTDIQINDTIAYNENTRKTFGILEGLVEDDVKLSSATLVLAGRIRYSWCRCRFR